MCAAPSPPCLSFFLSSLLLVTSGFTVPSWSTSSATQAPRVSGHTTSVSANGRVLLFGGLTGSAGSPCTTDLWSFGVDNVWRKVETVGGPGPRMCARMHTYTKQHRHFDLDAAHRYAASAFIEQSFYVFGGWDPEAQNSGGTFKDEVWKLDLDTVVWTAMAPMPCGPVSRHTACTLGDGTVLVHTFLGVFVLDQASGTLSEKSTSGDEPEGLSMCAASPLGDKSMLLFGGSTKTQGMSADTYVPNTASWTWRKLHPDGDGGHVPTPRASCSAAPADAHSCIIHGGAGLGDGGYAGGAGLTAYDETWCVTVEGDAAHWTELDTSAGAEAPPPARVAASLSALSSGRGFLLQGGWNPGSGETFDKPSVLVV